METFSALLALCEGNSLVTGGFPSQRPVVRSFDFFPHLNKGLRKQSRRRWFETPSRSLCKDSCWKICKYKRWTYFITYTMECHTSIKHLRNNITCDFVNGIHFPLQSVRCRTRGIESLRWRHNGHDCVSNHQPYDCLLNRLFRRRSKKHQSSASLAFVRGIHRGPVNSPHKWP